MRRRNRIRIFAIAVGVGTGECEGADLAAPFAPLLFETVVRTPQYQTIGSEEDTA